MEDNNHVINIDEELDDYGELIVARLKMEEEFIEEVQELRDESNQEEEVAEDEKLERKKFRVKDLFNYITRWRRLNDDKEEKENEDKAARMSDVLKEGFKGALAGFSIGQVMDEVLPREQLDAMTDLREDYIRMYGDEKIYKEIKSSMYKQIRELNKELGVSAFGGEDISEGLRQSLIANVPSDMADAFALSSAKLKKVGVDLGDSTAKAFSMGFKRNSVEVMDSLANVLASARVNEDVKTSITEFIAEVGKDISAMGLSPAQQKESAANLAATLSQLESSNIMTVDQAEEIKTIIIKATRGDADTTINLKKMGISAGQIAKMAKSGDWASAYQQVLTGIANSPLHAEVLKAMELDVDEEQIARLKSSKKEINSLIERTNEVVALSKVEVDGLSQAELRAREISRTSWAERFKNWTGTTRLIEAATDMLEKFNIDASTASSIIGGLAGAGKGLFDTFLLMKTSGFKIPGMIAKLIPSMTGLTASFAGLSASALPIIGVIAAIGALIGAGYLLYKNWDKVTKWFGRATDWIKNKIKGFTESIKNFASKIPGVGKLMKWFGGDDKKVEQTAENIVENPGQALGKTGEIKPESIGNISKDLDKDVKIESPALKVANNTKIETPNSTVPVKSTDDIGSKISKILVDSNKSSTDKAVSLLDLIARISASIDKKMPTPTIGDIQLK